MKVIEHFKKAIPLAEGDNYHLQAWFLHTLFPATYPLPELPKSVTNFKLTAAAGYAYHQGGAEIFEKGMGRICRLNKDHIPSDLLHHPSAALGLAWGIRGSGKAEWKEWWETQLLPLIRDKHPKTGFTEMLEAVSKGQPLALEGTYPEYAIAANLLASKSFWNSHQLSAYAIRMRKERFPYYPDDFFRTMLCVYILDHTLSVYLRSSEQEDQFKQEVKAQALSTIAMQLDKLCEKRARIQVGILLIFLFLTIVSATATLFVFYGNHLQLQAAWDTLTWAFLWFSGPIPAGIILIRLIYFLIKGQKMNLDILQLTSKYKDHLRQKWRSKLSLSTEPKPTPLS